MNIFIPNLDKNRSALGQQIASHGQPVAKIGQIRVDAVAPSVTEGLDLLWLAGDVIGLAVAHVAASGGPLEVGVEFDAVGRVYVDALHFAAQALAFGEGGHDL